MLTILTTLHSKYIHASLALPYLAAWCGTECGQIDIIEFTDHEPKESVAALLLADNPDVIAFSVYIWNREKTLALVDILHTIRPDLRIVLGGPEVSFDNERLFASHPGLTALIHGEGELPLQTLLQAWKQGNKPTNTPRLSWRNGNNIETEQNGPVLTDLDLIPSPFKLGLADLSRGFSYYETSRGCPYNCSFCMSALDSSVRSFSMERILDDLTYLIEQKVPKIKLVDRTFNYDAKRARQIFAFILEQNKESHFHFEIGAHLLDEETISLLERVPTGMFQFEIGVQSTLPQTLAAIDRKVSTDKVLQNVSALMSRTQVELHLDLIAGLPGESYADFMHSIDTVMALGPEHLQIEPVKLLPGAPLRNDAKRLGIRFDPNPPYTIVSGSLSYFELEKVRAISRLLDLSWNSGRLHGFLQQLADSDKTFSSALERLALFLKKQGYFRHPIGQTALFNAISAFVKKDAKASLLLREHLARDYALAERVLPNKAPDFFDTALTADESARVSALIQEEQKANKGTRTKLQFFVARFKLLPPHTEHLRLYIYQTCSGRKQQVIERILTPQDSIIEVNCVSH
jgi:anaerobic magnesium-protoporphyrin IX monomethyl ester cyclase